MDTYSFKTLLDYLDRVPAIVGKIGVGDLETGGWWVKLTIDIEHELAWRTVQELGYVLNYISIEERLPTVFMPVSPPPYLNGGPEDFLSWVIECSDPEFTPDTCKGWLETRLPDPVDDVDEWTDEC